MLKRIHVGNLPFLTPEEEVRALFEKHGTVHACELVTNKMRRPRSVKSRGFAFLEMEEEEADAAIAALNGSELEGRTLSVSEARTSKPEVKIPEIKDTPRYRGRRRW